ncbi:MAG: membrane protein insertase YidC [Candidatus Delongbacteria bacterium]|jgi:YidC/Oxa1 family membrane protein insertase|nr:membrane protein insertase YidC [Candidatus Delongbacteria bacterium]
MDKQSIIGLIVIAVLLIGFSIFTQPSKEEREERLRKRDSIIQAEQHADSLKKAEMLEKEKMADSIEEAKDSIGALESDIQTNTTVNEVVNDDELRKNFGIMADAARGTSKIITLENDRIKLKFNTKGGKIHSAELKNYKTHNQQDLILFEGDTAVKFGFEMFIENRAINTNNLYFKYMGTDSVLKATDNKPAKAVFRLQADSARYIDFVYTLTDESWMVDYDIRFNNMHELIARNINFFKLKWEAYVPGLEKGRTWETQNTTIQYRFQNGDVDKLKERKDEDEVTEPGIIDWIAYKQQFFSTILINEEGFDEPYFHAKTIETGPYIEKFTTEASLPYMHEADKTYKLKFYFGPNKYNTLKSYDLDMEEIIPLGWGIFGWFNKYLIIPVFNWLGNWIKNYGLIILLLTLIIKLILFPLTYRSYMSTAKMRVLKPQIEELNKKYPKGKEMEKQKATMALYKKAGANPMGGCLPMLLQMPILIALFRFFPASIELRQKSFLWAQDLSSYDSIVDLPFNVPMYGDHISLFTLLMAVSMVVSSKLNSSAQAGGQNQGMMKMMTWFMPIMLLLIFNNYAAGLSYYYFLANLITIIQTWVIRKYIVDDKAVMAKIEANKKKPAKKSKWQQKLEQAQKQQKRKR